MSLSNKLAKAGMMGDAYMGDPGLFGDIWGGIKSIGRTATGIVGGLGIPGISTAASLANRFLFRRAPGTTTTPTFAPAPMPLAIQRMPGGVQMIPSTLMRGGGAGPCPPGTVMGPGGTCINLPFAGAPGVGVTRQAPPMAGASMGGYHLNKTGYFLMDGSYVAPMTKWVKNRRRNPGNMKALSRSLGRIKSAKRMTQALSAITIRSACPPGGSRRRSKR